MASLTYFHGQKTSVGICRRFARSISGLITEELQKRPNNCNDNSNLGLGVGVGNDVKDDDNNDFLSGMLADIK